MIPQLQRDNLVSSPEITPPWSLAKRIGFRFIFSYFLLYIGPGAVGALGLNEKVTGYHAVFTALWHRIVPWFGTNVLGLNGNLTEVANGSGDQLYDYVLILCMLLAACIATIVWSLLDRRRTEYRQLYEWLKLGMRLLMVTAMMTYGAAKILPMQFADVPLVRLVDPLGYNTPQGLLWLFMGYSKAYSFFGGCAEMLGGLLLVVPRFTTLGALVSLGALSNVLMLNLCYDVPRKIFTTHLVLIAIFLILPDAKRLTDVFILNRTVAPTVDLPLLKDKQLNRGVLALQYFYCTAIFFIAMHVAYQGAVKNAAHVAPPLYGIWYVEDYAIDNASVPALVTNRERWHYVVFDWSDIVTIQPMEGGLQFCNFTLGEGGRSLDLVDIDHPAWKARFVLESRGSDQLLMTGEANGHAVTASLRRVDLSDPIRFQLPNRGFHWITQVPHWR
ncbi:MAG TPA: hypothetical protein VMD98_02785 [Bryocella sp.]|nr:hypothetical protein [Bryocella sp.]